jgi:hypothetical protein
VLCAVYFQQTSKQQDSFLMRYFEMARQEAASIPKPAEITKRWASAGIKLITSGARSDLTERENHALFPSMDRR